MIIRFYKVGTTEKIAVDDDPPMRQHNAGCHAMFEYAREYDGVFISDIRLPGWWDGTINTSDYFYGKCPHIGSLVSGWLNRPALEVIGFQIKPKIFWRTGNELYRFSVDDFNLYRRTKDNEEKAKIAEKYPPLGNVAVAVKPRRRKVLPDVAPVVAPAVPV